MLAAAATQVLILSSEGPISSGSGFSEMGSKDDPAEASTLGGALGSLASVETEQIGNVSQPEEASTAALTPGCVDPREVRSCGLGNNESVHSGTLRPRSLHEREVEE